MELIFVLLAGIFSKNEMVMVEILRTDHMSEDDLKPGVVTEIGHKLAKSIVEPEIPIIIKYKSRFIKPYPDGTYFNEQNYIDDQRFIKQNNKDHQLDSKIETPDIPSQYLDYPNFKKKSVNPNLPEGPLEILKRAFKKDRNIYKSNDHKMTTKKSYSDSGYNITTLSSVTHNISNSKSNLMEPTNHSNSLDKIKLIPTTMALFTYIVNNQGDITKKLPPISGISVYRNENDIYTDFWGKLEFNVKDGKLIDKTGNFEGKEFSSFTDLISNSRMSVSGFFIDKTISPKDEAKGIDSIKQIIADLAAKQAMDIKTFLQKKIPELKSFDQIILYNTYPLREDDIVDVCVCVDKECSEPCKEVRKVYRRDLK